MKNQGKYRLEKKSVKKIAVKNCLHIQRSYKVWKENRCEKADGNEQYIYEMSLKTIEREREKKSIVKLCEKEEILAKNVMYSKFALKIVHCASWSYLYHSTRCLHKCFCFRFAGKHATLFVSYTHTHTPQVE